MNIQNEIWKLVKGYENYEISNFGNVKIINYRNTGKERPVKSYISSRGYYNVGLTNEIGRKTLALHKLIATAFLNHIPDGTQKIVVDHKDNNPLNNSLNNLQLITQRENSSKDKFRKNIASKYTGVSWHKRDKIWRANIRMNGKYKHLGYFENEIDAHLSYQRKLKEIQDANA